MKMTRLFTITLMLALLVLGASKASAQAGIAPSSQFGIGINTSGAQIQYAITPGIQIGADVGLAGSSAEGSKLVLEIGPYGRFLLEGKVNPFVQVGFSIRNQDTTTSTSLYLAGGLEFFYSPNVGVFGTVNILNVPFADGAEKTYGLLKGGLGIEWYFDR
jgi:hypothetical protein